MSILPVSNEIALTMDIVILKWSELEQPCYYKQDEICYIRSLFSENEPVPIGLLMTNGTGFLQQPINI